MRPHKEILLFILYIMFERFWGLKLFQFLQPDGWTGIMLFIMVACIVYEHYFSRRKNLLNLSNSAPLLYIIAAVMLSMVMANVFYSQPYATSLLAYKTQYLLIGGFALLALAPAERQVITSLRWFEWAFVAAYITRAIFPSLFLLPKSFVPGEGFEISIPGYELLSLLLYFYLQDFCQKPDLKKFLNFAFLFAVIAIMQNRSILLPVAICSAYGIFRMKSRYKPTVILLICSLFVIAISSTWDIWTELYDQTIRELNNPKYERNKALQYFLTSASPNIWCALFGNGFLSAHTSSLMGKMMDNGVYNSDMGFIGYWNQFGIIPIIVFLYLIFRTLSGRRFPTYIKMYAFTILACSPTIMYFGQTEKIVCLLMFLYLFTLYNRQTDLGRALRMNRSEKQTAKPHFNKWRLHSQFQS